MSSAQFPARPSDWYIIIHRADGWQGPFYPPGMQHANPNRRISAKEKENPFNVVHDDLANYSCQFEFRDPAWQARHPVTESVRLYSLGMC